MGKIAGFMGALTAFGAVAYLMTPLPPQDPSTSAATNATGTSTGPVRTATPSDGPERLSQVASAAATPAASPPSLVQQIQSELRRLGCYGGDIDGQWTVATQRAMHTLGERASVLRPVDTPDYIMLALARSQANDVCAQPQARATAMTAPQSERTPALPQRPRVAGSVRPTMSEGAPTSQPWHVVVQRAAPKRPTEKSSTRTLASIGAPSPAATASPVEVERSLPDRSRMGLGAVDVEPLRAGIDPRDPSAPAILRGPSSGAPVTTAHAATEAGPPVDAPPPRRVSRASDGPWPSSSKQRRRAWQRSVFDDMQRNGP